MSLDSYKHHEGAILEGACPFMNRHPFPSCTYKYCGLNHHSIQSIIHYILSFTFTSQQLTPFVLWQEAMFRSRKSTISTSWLQEWMPTTEAKTSVCYFLRRSFLPFIVHRLNGRRTSVERIVCSHSAALSPSLHFLVSALHLHANKNMVKV